VGDDADGHELLAVVAAVHHERVGEALDDGALGLPESLLCVPAGRVGDVNGGSDLDVVAGGVLAVVHRFKISPSASSLLLSPALAIGDSYVNEISRISTSS
jgi:hypothetical protein